MKKVKFLVNTAYQGPRKEGDEITVPDDFAERWAKNSIAEIIGDAPAKQWEEPKIDDIDPDSKESGEPESQENQEDDKEPEKQEAAEVDYNKKSAKELYAICKEKGLDVEPKKDKAYYIEKLS